MCWHLIEKQDFVQFLVHTNLPRIFFLTGECFLIFQWWVSDFKVYRISEPQGGESKGDFESG